MFINHIVNKIGMTQNVICVLGA